VRALRNGERKHGRLLAPVMPYEWFHEMSDDDAFAVARYLKSLPPVRHEVRQAQISSSSADNRLTTRESDDDGSLQNCLETANPSQDTE
jgi:cytochrome c